jgi:hypothetical protein
VRVTASSSDAEIKFEIGTAALPGAVEVRSKAFVNIDIGLGRWQFEEALGLDAQEGANHPARNRSSRVISTRRCLRFGAPLR